LPALHAAQLQDLLTGVKTAPAKEITAMVDDKPVKQPNPEYVVWVAKGSGSPWLSPVDLNP
jgi:hypothetical protein